MTCPSLLSRRLTELEEAGVVRRVRPDEGDYWEYHLTEAGEELRPIVEALGRWGKRWSRAELSREDLDAGLLMWDVHRRLPADKLPDERIVVQFRFRDAPEEERDFWLVLDGGDVDLRIVTDVRTLTAVWLGDAPLSRAIETRKIRMLGPENLRRAFPGWLGLSLFAEVERKRQA